MKILLRKILLIFLVLYFVQCVPSKKIDSKQLNEIEKTINNYPINKRLVKWDSLLNSNDIDVLTKAHFQFDKANDLQIYNQEKRSIDYYNAALRTFKKFHKKEMIAKTLVNLGVSHAFLHHKSIAGKKILEGLKIANELDNDYIKSRAYGELAHIYYLNNNKEKAVDYLKKTIKMYKKMKDTAAFSAIYNNIGIIYKEEGKLKEAYNFFLKSIYLKDSINNPISLVESYSNLGDLIFLYKKDKKKALNYYRKALKIVQKNQYNPAEVYENLANIYVEMKQLDSAKYFIQKALKFAPENYEDKIHLYNTYLYFLLEQKKDTEALSILKIKDSLYNNQQELNEKENEKNIENKLSILSQQRQLQQARQLNKKNKIIFIFIIIIFILGLLISYQLNRLDRLNYKQEQFRLEQKVLRSQMNPHFIFNILSSIQNSLIENKPIVSATYLAKFAQLIRQNFDFVQKRNISLKEELQMLRNYLDTQKFRYKDKFDYQIIVDSSVNQAMTVIPPMILQPFIENAIEHGFKQIDYKGQIRVEIYKKQDKLCFKITDNGSGFQPKNDQKEHALDIFRKRLSMMSKATIDSYKITKLKQGTQVVFCLPYSEEI